MQADISCRASSQLRYYDDYDLLMLSGLQHIAYCERQWALIHVERQWQENYHTAQGELFHERAHLAGYSSAGATRTLRAVKIVSHYLGLTGEADVVEFTEDPKGSFMIGSTAYLLRPVEYKVGTPKVEDWDRLQVCAQAMCLEEMHQCHIDEGALFYGKTRRREVVTLDSELRERVKKYSSRMHELFEKKITPKAKKSSRCKRCSLEDVCLPSAYVGRVSTYWRDSGVSLPKREVQ